MNEPKLGIQSNKKESLNIRIQFIQGDVSILYSCALCDYQTGNKQHLLRHQETEHMEKQLTETKSFMKMMSTP